MRKGIKWTALLLTALMLTGCAQKADRNAPQLLEPVGVQSDMTAAYVGEIYKSAYYNASIKPYVEELSFRVSGKVSTVNGYPGKIVQEGDLLIELDQEDLQARADQLELELGYMQQDNKYTDEIAKLEIEILEAELKKLNAQAGEAQENELKEKESELKAKEAELQENKKALEAEDTALKAKEVALKEKQAALEALEITPEPSETPPEESEAPPEESETAPETGETPPEESETAPETSETPPEENTLTQEEKEAALREIELALKENEIARKSNKIAQMENEYALKEVAAALLENETALKQLELTRKEITLKKNEIDQKEALMQQNKKLRGPDLESKQNELTEISTSLDANRMCAPFTGRIIYGDQLTQGSWVNADDPVIFLADDSRLSIVSDYISESTILFADRIFALIGDQEYEVEYQPMEQEEFVALALSGATLTSTFEILGTEAELAKIEAGQYAAICLWTNYVPDALLVPSGAVMKDTAGKYVYVDENGSRVKRPVKTGKTTDGLVQIVEGLQEGDVVYVKD